MFKNTVLVGFREVIKPVLNLGNNEYYMDCPELDDARRTLRIYQNRNGTLFGISAKLTKADRFNLNKLLKSPERYGLMFHTINGDMSAVGEYLTHNLVRDYPSLLNSPVHNIILREWATARHCAYTLLVGGELASIKRFCGMGY